MHKTIKKITGITLGILFMIALALVPTLLIQGTVQGVRLAVKVKNLPKTLNKQQPPIASIEPIEKAGFYHFLPGTKAYALEAVDQDFSCTNCKGRTRKDLPPARTPAEVVKEATDAKAAIIVLTCSDTAASCDYSLEIAKLAKQNKLATALSYDGCLKTDALIKILPSLDAVKIELGSRQNDYCRNISSAPLAAALENIKTAKVSGIDLEISYLLDPTTNGSTEKINEFLNAVKGSIGQEAIIHFSSAANETPATSSENIARARNLAIAAGFKYVYAKDASLTDGENTFCANSSIALMRQDNFLIKDNTNKGVCTDGTTIPGIWR